MVADFMETEAGVSSEDSLNTQVGRRKFRNSTSEAFTDKLKGVYIYRPADTGKLPTGHPSKKRKVTREQTTSTADLCPFVPLLNGDESERSVRLRYQTYEQLWSVQEAKIQVSIGNTHWLPWVYIYLWSRTF